MNKTQLIQTVSQQINDAVYTSLLDNGFTPEEAYKLAFESDEIHFLEDDDLLSV